jgi:hypothetical protein
MFSLSQKPQDAAPIPLLTRTRDDADLSRSCGTARNIHRSRLGPSIVDSREDGGAACASRFNSAPVPVLRLRLFTGGDCGAGRQEHGRVLRVDT